MGSLVQNAGSETLTSGKIFSPLGYAWLQIAMDSSEWAYKPAYLVQLQHEHVLDGQILAGLGNGCNRACIYKPLELYTLVSNLAASWATYFIFFIVTNILHTSVHLVPCSNSACAQNRIFLSLLLNYLSIRGKVSVKEKCIKEKANGRKSKLSKQFPVLLLDLRDNVILQIVSKTRT